MIFSLISLISPIGELIAISDDTHLLRLEFSTDPHISKKIQYYCPQTNTNNLILKETQKQLQEYFDGKRKKFDIPLSFSGTDFQEKGWKALQKIPYGNTWSYTEQAREIGNPKATRALGNTNHHNPLKIIVPCHRVIRKSGIITGYAGGIENQQWLFQHEQSYQ